MPGEIDPVGGKGIDMRRPDDRMPGHPEAIAAPLIGGDEEDVVAHDISPRFTRL